MPLLDPVPLADIVGASDISSEYSAFQLINYPDLELEMSEYGVKLADDPTAEGILKLNGTIAQIDAQKTRVANIVGTAIRNENDLEILYRQIQGIYKREYDLKLPQPPVSEFSNAQSREAACNSLLGELKALVNSIEGSYSQAKTFTKMSYNALGKLDSTNKNISRQITVLQLANEIGEIARPSQTNKKGEEYTF